MSEADELIHNYLVDLCPEEMLHALQGLATIQYPVNDARELEERLRGHKRKPGLLALLRPVDFPLAGPRNAFEKLSVRTQEVALPERPIIEPSVPPPGHFGDRTEPGRSAWDNYREAFSPFCAEQAYAEYLRLSQSLEPDDPDTAAYFPGFKKGEECEKLVAGLRRWHLRPITQRTPPPRHFSPP